MGGRTPSVLMVFPWCLDHLGHGNIQRVLAMADYLSAAGLELDLVYQGNPKIASRASELRAFRRVLRVEAWRSSDDLRTTDEIEAFYGGYEAPTFVPGTALTAVVRGLLDAVDYTAVIASYAWTAPIFEPLANRALRIVDLLDVMSLHGARCEQATGGSSQFTMARETEEYLWRQWDVLLAITPEEAAVVGPSLRPAQRLLTVPHAVNVQHPAASAGHDVVYTGSDNGSNLAAVSWLLSDVWPKVVAARPAVRLRLVGLIADAIRKTPLAATPNVDLVGFVEDPAAEVARASIVVAPYLYGSGLKLKVVEAAASGRPLVTTSNGIEGTGLVPGRDVFIAADPGEFADAIVTLADDADLRRTFAAAARVHVERTFTAHACYQPLVDLIRQHVPETQQAGVIPSSAEERLRKALAALDRAAVVVWGNGSHTRALLEILKELGARPRCIVDKSASVKSVSPEGIDVVPLASFTARADDLVVLSSQSFEAEMWRDVLAVAGGSAALGLYRRELVTPALAIRMRSLSRRRDVAAAATNDISGSRLVIVDPAAGTPDGVFHQPARALQAVARARGSRVVVAGSSRLAVQDLDSEDRQLLHPTFTFSPREAMSSLRGDVWRGVSRLGRMYGEDLSRLSSRLGLDGNDVVLLATANLVEVMGAAEWLKANPVQRVPELRLLFHALPALEAEWLRISEAELRHAYCLALGMLDEASDGGLRLLAGNSALADALSAAFDRSVQAVAADFLHDPSSVLDLVMARGPVAA